MFDIPVHHSQSTGGAKREYEKMWGQPFPGDDAEIRRIAAGVPSCNDLKVEQPFGTNKRCEHMLWMMLERVTR